jgi:hypothetical protein
VGNVIPVCWLAYSLDGPTSNAIQARQENVAELASQIQSAEISDDDSAESQRKPSKTSHTKKHTLAEIKEQVKLQEGSSVSFVIIGTCQFVRLSTK